MSDRNQGGAGAQGGGESSSVTGMRDAVVEGVRRQGETVMSAASAAAGQVSDAMDSAGEYASYAGEYASEAMYGVRRQVQRIPTGTALICVGLGLLVGGIALTYFGGQQQGNPPPINEPGRRSGRQPRQRGARKGRSG